MSDSPREAVEELRQARREASRPAVLDLRFHQWVPAALILGDAGAVLLAFIAAAAIHTGRAPYGVLRDFWTLGGIAIMCVWLTVLWSLGLYERKIDLSVVSTLPTLAIGASVSTMLILLGDVLAGPWVSLPRSLDHEVVVIAWAMSLGSLFIIRTQVRSAQKSVRSKGVSEKRTLILGAGQVGTMLARKMLRSPELGLVPVAFWDAEPPDLPRRDTLNLPVYRRDCDLDSIIVAERINHVMVAFSAVSFHEVVTDLEHCLDHPVEITIVPRFFEIVAARIRMDEIEGIPIACMHRQDIGRLGRATKRLIDIVLSATGLVLISPILVAAALAIRADSGSPVLFRQLRVGKKGKPFTMYKFRSMRHTAERDKAALIEQNEISGPLFKIRRDPRVTSAGQWMRRYSIDELPQLINVLKGDMSLVGPRPPLPDEVSRYSEWQLKRLSITPGITGLWQILGRTELSFDEMVSLDLNYIWNWSPWLDFCILVRTLGAVLHGKGAC